MRDRQDPAADPLRDAPAGGPKQRSDIPAFADNSALPLLSGGLAYAVRTGTVLPTTLLGWLAVGASCWYTCRDVSTDRAGRSGTRPWRAALGNWVSTLVEQEFWGLLVSHYAIRSFMHEA
jgi:hypothetical protein